VIPTRSRPGPLRSCLEALAAVDPEVAREVIVVDDGSPRHLTAAIEACTLAAGARFLRQPPAGPAAARNRGAAAATAELLVFLDDDCRPQPGWLAALLRALAPGSQVIVGGPTVNGAPGNLYAEATQLLVAYVSHHSASGQRRTEFLPTCNLALARSSFETIGGFDEAFSSAAGEDREFCTRGLRRGFEVRFVGDATVYHFHHLTLRTYVRQHFTYGRGAVLYRRRCRSAGPPTTRASLRWYLGLLACPFRRQPLWRALPICSLLLLAQGATAAGAVAGALRAG